jgi:S-DNA-T family DNA segregation ATPase FtsK/SpoIIIE
VASRIEQQVAVIRRAWELMEYRYQLVVDGLARSEDFEPLIVFIDEFTDLKANLLTWYPEIKVKGDPPNQRPWVRSARSPARDVPRECTWCWRCSVPTLRS